MRPMTFVEPGTPSDLARAARDGFRATYGAQAQLVGRAPGRVNLIGEHTDYNRGLVLPLALPHATYAAVAERDDDLSLIHISEPTRLLSISYAVFCLKK